jgi:hypothetical protein
MKPISQDQHLITQKQKIILKLKEKEKKLHFELNPENENK